jgi:hypothetical protein
MEKVRPCDIHKLVNSLKLRKACGLDGIPNECLRHEMTLPSHVCTEKIGIFPHPYLHPHS